jgi:hypothetical protein
MPDSRNTATETVEPDNREKIAARAYELWIERGCPIGTPEIDWFQAVAEHTGTESIAEQPRRRAA